MLKNACLLAKIGADAAENERDFAEILPKIGNYPTGPRSQSAAMEGSVAPCIWICIIPIITALGTWAGELG